MKDNDLQFMHIIFDAPLRKLILFINLFYFYKFFVILTKIIILIIQKNIF